MLFQLIKHQNLEPINSNIIIYLSIYFDIIIVRTNIMKLYQTKLKNLLPLIPEFLNDKAIFEDILLMNEFFMPNKQFKEDFVDYIQTTLKNLDNPQQLTIFHPEKKAALEHLANKNYSRKDFQAFSNINSKLFNNEDLFINDDFSFDRENSILIVAKIISFGEDSDVYFWSANDPLLAPTPMEAFEVSSNESYSEAKYQSLNYKSFFSLLPVEDKSIMENVAYPILDESSYNIFEAAKIPLDDIVGVEILLDRISNLSKDKPDDIKEWYRFLNIPNYQQESFFQQLQKYRYGDKHPANSIITFQQLIFINALKKLPETTINNPIISKTIIKFFIDSNFLLTQASNHSQFLFGNDDMHKIALSMNILGNPETVNHLLEENISPLQMLYKHNFRGSNQKDKTWVNCSPEASFYGGVLTQIIKKKQGTPDIENIIQYLPQYQKQFIQYYVQYIKQIEKNLLSSSNLPISLSHITGDSLDAFVFGFPFLSKELRENPAMLSFISRHTHDLTLNLEPNSGNAIVPAIIHSYEPDFLFKNKRYFLNFNKGLFSSVSNNHNISEFQHVYKSPYLQNLAEYFVAKELHNVIQNKSIEELDLKFMSISFQKYTKEASVPHFSHLVEKYKDEFPHLKEAANPEFIKFMIPYLNKGLSKLKERYSEDTEMKSQIDDINNTIVNLSSIFCLYAYKKDPSSFDNNPIGITFENLQSYRNILAFSAHFSIVNKQLFSQLDINNEAHHQIFQNIISKSNKTMAQNIIQYKESHPFFMLDNVIKSLYGNTRFINFSSSELTLGNVYNSSQVKELFDRYGKEDKTWFLFSPDTFLSLAPLEVKQDLEIWTNLFKKYEFNIIPYMPMNLKMHPDTLLKFLEEKPSIANQTLATFPEQVKDNIIIVRHILEHHSDIATANYSELIKFLDNKLGTSKGQPKLSYLEKFNLIFEEKMLEIATPVNNTTKSKAIKF